jgi:hypothetical protein
MMDNMVRTGEIIHDSDYASDCSSLELEMLTTSKGVGE